MYARTLLAVMALTPAAFALPEGFVAKEFANADGTKSPYLVYLPPGLKPDAKPPVILFLHGAGETKGGKKQPVEVGLPPHLAEQKDFPAVVVIPQCEVRKTGWSATGPDGARALAMLDATIKEYRCDESRQYLTGLSMGGYGTWSIATAYPTRFAAIAPVCGGGDPAQAAKLKDLPCWCFHGGADATVKPEKSRAMVDAIRRAGGTPKYTEYEGVGHNSWDKAYTTEALYTWLFEQKR